MSDDHHYLAEIRKQSAGGKVTVYRNREWILKALDDGVTKRAIFTILHEREGLAIGYATFAKHVQKLVAIRAAQSTPATPTAANPLKPKSGDADRSKAHAKGEVTEIKRYVHNPIPNLDDLI